MAKSRIYVKDLKTMQTSFLLSGENSKIVKNVLRCKKGDVIELVDGEGTLAGARIEKFSQEGFRLKIQKRVTYPKKAVTTVTLLQAIPKGERSDFVVQKMVELGATRLIFFPSQRSVTVLKKDKIPLKKKRFEKIAMEALRQSKRLFDMEVIIAKNLKECLRLTERSDLKLLFHEEQTGTPIKVWLNHFESPKNIVFAIGPEGSFTKEEVIGLVSAGFKHVKLGEEVLRTETAPVAVMSILNYKYRW